MLQLIASNTKRRLALLTTRLLQGWLNPRIRWIYLLPILAVHLLALCALFPYAFSWTGVAVAFLGVHVFGQGINLCYHRGLTHRSFHMAPWLERCFVILAVCCMQDTPAQWVAHHRRHHQHSDDVDDPHSPNRGGFWAHMGWLFVKNPSTHSLAALFGYSRDILEDPFYFWLERRGNWIWIFVAHVLLFFMAGFAIGGWTADDGLAAGLQFGTSLVVWGVLVRTVVVWHITWSVNSLSHLWGYRNYATSDDSRNNWLVALLTVGEGWHNNHHHDPTCATTRHQWWELDITYLELRLLERLGLVSDIVPRLEQRQRQHRARPNIEKSAA
ncbi:MAG: fatty acid desaturase [Planctomycetota bacterium]